MKARLIGTVLSIAAVLPLATATAYTQPPPPPEKDAPAVAPAAGEGTMPPPPPGAGGGWKMGRRLGRHQLKDLDLTAEQQEKIDAQRKEQRAAMRAMRDALKAKHEELRAEIDKEKSDPAKIEGIAAELKKLEAQRIDQEVKGILRMKETLTPEQFQKLGSMREERRGGRRGRMGKGPRGRGRGERPDEEPEAD